MKKALVFLAFVMLGLPLLAVVWGKDGEGVMLHALLVPPLTGGYLLGSDELGRDVLARLAEGVRLSLGVSVGVGFVTFMIGVPLGLWAGWAGGWVDRAVMKLCDVVLSFPGILMAMALTALAGPGVGHVIVALGILGWVGFCRLVRGQVLLLKTKPFMAAATLQGVPMVRLWVKHLLPNCGSILVVQAVVVLAGAIVAEAGLSFLGLGVAPPAASLGGMLREGARVMVVAPHLVLAPAVVLISLTLCLNVLADGLRKRLENGISGS